MSGIQVTTSPTLNWRIALSPILTTHLLIVASASVATATKRRNKRDYFTTIKTGTFGNGTELAPTNVRS